MLQSDFLASVREVYEHVYETVDIQGSQVHYNIMFISNLTQRFYLYNRYDMIFINTDIHCNIVL